MVAQRPRNAGLRHARPPHPVAVPARRRKILPRRPGLAAWRRGQVLRAARRALLALEHERQRALPASVHRAGAPGPRSRHAAGLRAALAGTARPHLYPRRLADRRMPLAAGHGLEPPRRTAGGQQRRRDRAAPAAAPGRVAQDAATRARRPGPAVRRRVMDYVDAHLDAPLTLAELAGVAALSTYHFARMFHTSFGEPPHACARAGSSAPRPCWPPARATWPASRRPAASAAPAICRGSSATQPASRRASTAARPDAEPARISPTMGHRPPRPRAAVATWSEPAHAPGRRLPPPAARVLARRDHPPARNPLGPARRRRGRARRAPRRGRPAGPHPGPRPPARRTRTTARPAPGLDPQRPGRAGRAVRAGAVLRHRPGPGRAGRRRAARQRAVGAGRPAGPARADLPAVAGQLSPATRRRHRPGTALAVGHAQTRARAGHGAGAPGPAQPAGARRRCAGCSARSATCSG